MNVLNATTVAVPSRTELVLEAVKRAILTGELKPGQPLVETELAHMLGVSKTPVREALKTLAGAGLVEMSQYKGASVRPVDAAMAHAVSDVRLLLEPEAVYRSVELGASTDRASEALGRAERADDAVTRSLANREFHRALYAPCGNPLLTRVLDDLRDQTALVSVAAWKSMPSWELEAAEHRSILEAAQAGDPQEASALMREHIAGFVSRTFPQDQDSRDQDSRDQDSRDRDSRDQHSRGWEDGGDRRSHERAEGTEQ
ncbi:GntR family transcriptional regulator [Wenjunlia tyrosinilytica]|uniref:Transcriptional regulator n=1 Tax=Wenjunlia tyrosinilytica TaxID=1544741 RepID=A0A917ZTY2_9ACTN|nr:GntR family transcriptional regulator [Wenjunlia tyrosinilytica]GGO94956.1 transcriptional regulator [Wenjunlia tyrosinilytica]